VRTALIGGLDMMNLIGGNIATGLQALLAERMLGNIQIPDLAPAVAVGLVVIGSSAVFVILPTGNGLMLGTVSFMGQRGAAGIPAGLGG